MSLDGTESSPRCAAPTARASRVTMNFTVDAARASSPAPCRPAREVRAMATEMQSRASRRPPAETAPVVARLLPPLAKRSLAEHLEWYGEIPGGRRRA